MKAITAPYRYFGRQCKHCGSYFIYDFRDAIASNYCPTCYTRYDHRIDDPDVDFDPDIEEIKAQRKLRGEGFGTMFLPPFNVGQSVAVIYNDLASASWKYYGYAVIQQISCKATATEQVYSYVLDAPIFCSATGVPISTTENGLIEVYSSSKDPNLLAKVCEEDRARLTDDAD